MIGLTLNGQKIEVPPGTTLLQAARANGISIPTLCDHPALKPIGGCRLCVVEVEGARGPQPACTLPASEGMVVRTETPALAEARRAVLALLLSNYYDAGYATGGAAETEFEHWVRHYGASAPAAAPRVPVGADPNPFVWVDMNKCIVCTRCVRVCAEVQGRFVWGTSERGYATTIVAGADTPMLEAACESCGACVAVCPTGALDNKLSMGQGRPDRLVTTTCTYCGVGCQFDLNVRDTPEGGRIIRVTSNPAAPVNGLALCVKGRYGYDFVHHPDRLTRPKVRQYLLDEFAGAQAGRTTEDGGRETGDGGRGTEDGRRDRGRWVEVDWETALDLTARKLRATRDTHGANAVGLLTSAKCLNEENYLMNKLARQVIGTNSIDHCARL
jgi:predicted molibdopterin-dependent oxidoreductase YjgC